MIWGDRIKELRLASKISQTKLGEAVGVSQQSVYQWESGKSAPDLESLIKVAAFFDVTADYILGITDNPSVHFHLDDPNSSEFVTIVTENKKAPTSKQREDLYRNADEAEFSGSGVPVDRDDLVQLIDERFKELFNGVVPPRIGE